MLLPRLPLRIYYILAMVFPKITKKEAISIQFDGKVTHYFQCGGQGSQILEQFPGPARIMAVADSLQGIG